jgi:hypothetical protein
MMMNRFFKQWPQMKLFCGLFCHLPMKLEDCLLPLTWWKSHQVQFLNVSFVAQQILGILGSQIKTKRIFNIAKVLTSLQCCRLGVNNLNKLVMVMKNWSSDARADYLQKGDYIDDFFNEESNIIEDNNMALNATNYFNVDALELWIWVLMGIGFAMCRIAKLSPLVARCISEPSCLLYTSLMIHGTDISSSQLS